MIWCTVIAAAGRGERFGRPKQLMEVAGKPLAAWSIELFGSMPEVIDLVIATEREYLAEVRAMAARYAPQLPTIVTCGGATRQASVRAALECVPQRCTGVLVHDGARPLVQAADVRAGMRVVRPGVAGLLAVPVVDTIKVVDAERRVTQTLERGALWAAQTPQFATTREMCRAHEEALRAGVEATDDAALLERIGVEVIVVPSVVTNFKVTHPWDHQRAESLLQL